MHHLILFFFNFFCIRSLWSKIAIPDASWRFPTASKTWSSAIFKFAWFMMCFCKKDYILITIAPINHCLNNFFFCSYSRILCQNNISWRLQISGRWRLRKCRHGKIIESFIQMAFEVAWLGSRVAKLRHGEFSRRFDCITWIRMQSKIFEIFMRMWICPRTGTIYWCEPLLSKIWWFRFSFSHFFWIHQFAPAWFQ